MFVNIATVSGVSLFKIWNISQLQGKCHPLTWLATIQKKIIRIIMIARNRDSCRHLFKNLRILLLKLQYIFSLLLFVAKNKELYESNSKIPNINARFCSDLRTSTANLTTF